MSLRDLVAGSDMCTPSGGDGAGPSNAMGTLVNTLLGGAGKTQEQLRELPAVHPGLAGPSQQMPADPAALALASGSGLQVPGVGPATREHAASVDAFLQSIGGPSTSSMGPVPPAEWDQLFGAQRMPGGPVMAPMRPPGAPGTLLPPTAAPAAMVSSQLQAFLRSARSHSHFAAGPLPPELSAQLSVSDKVRIRNRSTILARQVYADMGDRFADEQVQHLLASMHIHPAELPAQLPHVHDAAFHEAWAASASATQRLQHQAQQPVAADMAAGAMAAAGAQHAEWEGVWRQRPGPPSTGWANEFEQLHPPPPQPPLGPRIMMHQPPPASAWAEEFQTQQGQATTTTPAGPGQGWAEEFTQETASEQASRQRNGGTSDDAMATTRAMVDVLSRDDNPKMKSSKFLQFVSKMSKGELIFEDNKVVELPAAATSWANEFDQHQQTAGPSAAPASWLDEFARQQNQQQQPEHATMVPAGAGKGLVGDWADEFARGVATFRLEDDAGALGESAAAWAEQFAQGEEETYEEWERLYGHGMVETSFMGGPAGVTSREYVFAPNNPFLGDEQAFVKGRDLFRRGVLTEAALALEAEVQAHPDNAEAWRLLGTVHAENDDDRQAIAAMLRAHRADPRDLAVLLALGVSHTNELDQGEAVAHLRSWLLEHPDYRQVAEAAGPPPDSSQRVSHVVRMFEEASRQAPSDAELHMALGVLSHLARNYDGAVAAFKRALDLRPQDYSLWNKLGATLANNGRSAEALAAYQKALDLKPNYMRAWTNMGISYANLGQYDRSGRFYVRALALNPSAAHVWGYLRTSLACAGKYELMAAVDSKDLGALHKELSL